MIHVLFKFAGNPYGGVEVDVTSNSGFWSDLSPFLLNARRYGSCVFENLWQYSKVYREQVDARGDPMPSWYTWRDAGFANSRAVRYPMGKGAKPLYLLWNGEHLSYVDARKRVYASVYADLVRNTRGYEVLSSLYLLSRSEDTPLVLRDYDAYDHVLLGKTLCDVINDPNRKCGHGFVLAMMLSGELEKCVA